MHFYCWSASLYRLVCEKHDLALMHFVHYISLMCLQTWVYAQFIHISQHFWFDYIRYSDHYHKALAPKVIAVPAGTKKMFYRHTCMHNSLGQLVDNQANHIPIFIDIQYMFVMEVPFVPVCESFISFWSFNGVMTLCSRTITLTCLCDGVSINC